MQPKIFFLLAISNTLPQRNSSSIYHFVSPSFKYKHKTYFNFDLLNTNFYFKRELTTIYNTENVSKSFVYQPSSQIDSSLSFDNNTTSHQTSHESSHHIRNISQVYPGLDDFTTTAQQQSKDSLMILIGWW